MKFKNSKEIFLLVVILLLFFATRIYKIGDIPQSLYWDEASVGYNAFSIANTLRDEWGKFLPLHFRAFGEFKLPVYIYTTSIFVKLFGLSNFSVRLPAVIFSLGTIIFTYLAVTKISGNKGIGVLAAFFLSTSPWLFIFSRIGYEVSAGLMFFVLGYYFFLKSFEKEKLLILWSISWVLSMYSYNSFRIITPILAVIFLGTYLSKQKKITRVLVISIILLMVSFIPAYRLTKDNYATSRYAVVKETKTSAIVKNYFSHFDFKFLLSGDTNPRSQVPGFGQVWILDIPIILAGAIFIFKKNKKLVEFLPLIILVVAPIPAAITKESPHAMRSILMVFVLSYLWAYGASFIANFAGKYKMAVATGIVLISLVYFGNYLNNFFGQYNSKASKDWQYGYKEIFLNHKDKIENSNKIVISDEYAQPYIFALYYLKYPPQSFWKEVKYNSPDKWGFSTVNNFSNLEFKKIEAGDYQNSSLVFASKDDIKPVSTPDSEIKFLDGSSAFSVFEK